jgi:hypothetical protein
MDREGVAEAKQGENLNSFLACLILDLNQSFESHFTICEAERILGIHLALDPCSSLMHQNDSQSHSRDF